MSSGQELLELSEEVLSCSEIKGWTRIAAVLARHALEESIREFWAARGFELIGTTSMRCQLICLKEFCRDPSASRTAAHIWWELSRACHHHPYELAPTWDQTHTWLEEVRGVVRSITAEAPAPDPVQSPPTASRDTAPLFRLIEEAENPKP